MTWGLPVFAVLLPLVPFAQVASGNPYRISLYDEVLRTLPIVAGFIALIYLARILFRRADISDLLIGIVAGALFLPIVAGREFPVLPWCIVSVALLLAVLFWAESRRFLPGIIAIGCAALLAPSIMALAATDTWSKRPALTQLAAKAFDAVPAPSRPVAEKPDIFYFVFDRYQRADYLQKIYGIDNSSFIAELRKRGFYVADEAYSNYQRTAHSVVSSLNFGFLDKMQSPESEKRGDWHPIFAMFQDFRIGRLLKSFGYDFHFYGSWWEATRRIAIADMNHTFYEMPELARVVFENSLVVEAARRLGFRGADPLYWQCQRSRLMFESLQNVAAGDKPQFHFAHFLIPHPPFVTHEDGHCMDIAEASARSRAQNYGGQVAYANEQILKTIDALMARPGAKPIIILQADEGPWPEKFASDEITELGRDVSAVDWTTVDAETLREKMAIFSAIYAPQIPAADLSPRMTPVNTFRKILRHVFGVPIEDLPDRSMIYLSNTDLYSFKDVTDLLNGP